MFVHKSFGCELNVVIIERINIKTEKSGHAILFGSNIELNREKLIDYYSLRFQIELNFRDAKQHFRIRGFYDDDGSWSGKCREFIIYDG